MLLPDERVCRYGVQGRIILGAKRPQLDELACQGRLQVKRHGNSGLCIGSPVERRKLRSALSFNSLGVSRTASGCCVRGARLPPPPPGSPTADGPAADSKAPPFAAALQSSCPLRCQTVSCPTPCAMAR